MSLDYEAILQIFFDNICKIASLLGEIPFTRFWGYFTNGCICWATSKRKVNGQIFERTANLDLYFVDCWKTFLVLFSFPEKGSFTNPCVH